MDKKINKNEFDLLSRIQKVEVSPFLITRIKERIENKNSFQTSKNIAWTFGISFVFVVILNISALTKGLNQNNQKGNLIENMSLMPDNNLYK